MQRTQALCVMALAMALSSCAYIRDRARDLGDCFVLSASAGYGVSANVEAGPIGIGVLGHRAKAVGLASKCRAGVWDEWAMGLPVPQIYGFVKPDTDIGTALVTSGYHAGLEDGRPNGTSFFFCLIRNVGGCYGSPFCDEGDAPWTDWFRIEASAHCLVGARAGFNPAELVDFLVGWTGVDIAGDDGDRSPPDSR